MTAPIMKRQKAEHGTKSLPRFPFIGKLGLNVKIQKSIRFFQAIIPKIADTISRKINDSIGP